MRTCSGSSLMVSGICNGVIQYNPHYVIHTAFARFSEAILDYMADQERATSGQVQLSQFEGHISSAFDQLFNVWLLSKESKVSCMYMYTNMISSCMYMSMYSTHPKILHMIGCEVVCDKLLRQDLILSNGRFKYRILNWGFSVVVKFLMVKMIGVG